MTELDVSLLLSVGFLLIILLLIIFRILKLYFDEKTAQNRMAMLLKNDEGEQNRTGNRPLIVAGQRRVVGGRRRFNAVNTNRYFDFDAPDQEHHLSDEEASPMPLTRDEFNVGKKKLAKMQVKADKKASRETEQIEREERKQRQLRKEQQEIVEENERKLKEKLRIEAKMKEKEERERCEYEEYLKLREHFDVEEEGFDAVKDGETDTLLRDFVDYMHITKVVNMDELAAHFGLRTRDVLDRVRSLEQTGHLTGVTDDRGKFVCITSEELQAVARFINQRGRVSVEELADYSNQLIQLHSQCQ